MNSYEKVLSTVNERKTPAPRTTCVCGKEIFVKQLEKHQRTALHHCLMFKKKQMSSTKV